jgi:hypothetical protein
VFHILSLSAAAAEQELLGQTQYCLARALQLLRLLAAALADITIAGLVRQAAQAAAALVAIRQLEVWAALERQGKEIQVEMVLHPITQRAAAAAARVLQAVVDHIMLAALGGLGQHHQSLGQV